uniref:Uncharacterized protein n=1 Tax=Panagrolaimus sp. ES5 TaxID=591445 RepID=A0AC34FND0_9BILA
MSSDYEDNAVDFSKVDWDDEQKKTKVKSGALRKVDVVGDLLKSIQSSKNLDGIKKQLKVGSKKKKVKTLDAPLHRQAKRRIESNVAYQEAKKDLRVWNEVVFENRIAEQITYPLNPEDNEALKVERAADKVKGFIVSFIAHIENRIAEQITYPLNPEDNEALKVERAADKVKGFIPRTELERQMAEVLGKSKNNLKNDDMYTEAEKEIIKAMSLKEAKAKCQELQNIRRLQTEKEIIKAMSLKEAKAKCQELQNIRRLQSYQEAKFRRQAKIKSKQYHRIKKRQERRNQIKEFEELLVKDPEAAKEKLIQLQTDRAYERATLRHRGQNKWSRALKQYASRNPELQKMVAEHMKFGRELKSKLGKNLEDGFSSSDEEDAEIEQKAKLTMEEIMKMAAEEAKREAEDEASKKIENVNDNPWLKESVAKLRAKKAAMREKMRVTEEHFEALREEGEFNGPDFEVPDDSFSASLNDLIKEK